VVSGATVMPLSHAAEPRLLMPELGYAVRLRRPSSAGSAGSQRLRPTVRTVLEQDDFVVPRSTITHPPWLALQSNMANGRPPSMLNDAVFELIQGRTREGRIVRRLASAMN